MQYLYASNLYHLNIYKNDSFALMISSMSKVKLTPKQNRFCELYASGELGSQKACYFEAYDVELDDGGKIPKWVETEACLLLQNPKITQRIEELINQKSDKLLASSTKTKDYILRKLFRLAEETENEQSQLKSLELLGKQIALWTDKIETRIEHRQPEDIEQELEQKIQQLLKD
tara:strand:+ start:36 stop:557 length:522 start_codon:yes stop_codon:yes gene_type:complete